MKFRQREQQSKPNIDIALDRVQALLRKYNFTREDLVNAPPQVQALLDDPPLKPGA